MARTDDTDESAQLSWNGEVWTDARGYATVSLPRSVTRLHGDLEYELQPVTRGVTARVAGQLIDGRFAIETDEPHVKVAWRVRGQGLKPARQKGKVKE